MRILTINSGSSSVKVSLYEMGETEGLMLSGSMERIGLRAGLFRIKDSSDKPLIDEHADLPDHAYWEKWFPADWVSEMREQIRLWFYSQFFMSVTLVGRSPYRRAAQQEKRMRDAVIVEAVRTPVGKRNGGLSGVHPVDLSAHVLRAVAERSGIDPALVDDVIWGCVSQVGEQSWNVGRSAALAAGWPESVPGTTIDRQCGSSQQAVHFAAQAVMSGTSDLVIAAGGGGIPVAEQRAAKGPADQTVDAVIDKDRSARLIASLLGAQALLLVTSVDRVMLDYRTPAQSELGTITAAEASRHLADGQFPPGSMGPKIEAALRFLAEGGDLAVITSPRLLAATLTGGESLCGTRIERDPCPAEQAG